jgi:hypothetical protein
VNGRRIMSKRNIIIGSYQIIGVEDDQGNGEKKEFYKL